MTYREIVGHGFGERPPWCLRPVAVVAVRLSAPVLVVSLEHAERVLGEPAPTLVSSMFMDGSAPRGLWLISHPEVI